ncbi:MmcQ/YjbR family DNA-binding protein [Aeromicrobium alkaliterrae]|uniref:MmcQ/YjbR family DNA-binding protein n=1 Tax=Aeromicrobium alkaliterrae TaxID=302168 RepID=A0ABN2KD65_9ACTN
MATTWDELVGLATSTFPDTEVSTSWGNPSLKVKGKMFARLRLEKEAHGALALKCSLEDKEALLASGDAAFFTIPHYDGYGYVLVDLERVDPAELRELVTDAWLIAAPVRVRQAWEATR